MTTWTMAQAKRDFSIGYLTSFNIERNKLSGGWYVVLHGGSAVGPLLDVRSKEPRLFKTLDALVSAMEQIGFTVDGLASN